MACCKPTDVLTLLLRAHIVAVVAAERGRHLVDLRAGGRAETVPISASLVPPARRLVGRLADVAIRATPLDPGPGLRVEVVGLQPAPTGLLSRAGFAVGWCLGRLVVLAARLLDRLPGRRPT
jgi:hypothetical protein